MVETRSFIRSLQPGAGTGTAIDVEDLARALLQASPDCVKIITLDGRLRFMNTNGLCLMELDSFGLFLGAEWASLWPEPAQDTVRAAVVEAIESGFARFEGFCPTAKGTPKWWDVQVSAIPGRSGAAEALLSVSRDITELKGKQHALERALNVQEEFVANLSHELRTPLTGILGFADVLLGCTAPESKEAEPLRHIQEAGRSLLALLNDLLELTRVGADRLRLHEAPCELPMVMAAVDRLAAPLVGDKPIHFTWDDGGPELAAPFMLDEHRVQQVLLNLVSNAVKFTDAGEITVRARRIGDFARIEVSDTGEGIPAGLLPRVFDRFMQADAGSGRRHAGVGLGLAICRELVQRMGGEIGAASDFGRGSLFWFTLPLRPAPTIELPVAPARSEPARALQILVAEDNPVNQRLFRAILEAAGHTVVIAGDGAEAVRLAESARFDIALMDIQMPVLDGVSAIRRLRSNPALAGLPILAITANALPGQVDGYLAAGASDWIAKPFTTSEVLTALAKAMQINVAADGSSGPTLRRDGAFAA